VGKDSKKDFTQDSVADHLWNRSATPGLLLWHYTSGNGLFGIAHEKSLWCTEYRHLNDRAEMSVFAEQFQNSLQTALKNTNTFSSEDIERLVSTSNLYRTWNVFICSFCADADRNEHWQQYAKRAGYALAFDASILRTLATAQGYSLAPVVYGDEKAEKVAAAVLQDNLSKFMTFNTNGAKD
jgi:hypothetical protein